MDKLKKIPQNERKKFQKMKEKFKKKQKMRYAIIEYHLK